jgi:ABC-type Fe3+-hydroxamate transport system substrate-binding protein
MMKSRIIIIMIIMAIFTGLVACNQESKTQVSNKKSNVTENKNKNTERNIPKKQYENQAFKEVVVTANDQDVVVTGKASVFEGVFQYAIITGNKIVLEDKYQTVGAPAWGDFHITFAKDLVKEEGATFELFVYSAKDGSKIDVLKIPLNNK